MVSRLCVRYCGPRQHANRRRVYRRPHYFRLRARERALQCAWGFTRNARMGGRDERAHRGSRSRPPLVTIGDEGFYGLNESGGIPCPPGHGPSGRQWWCDGSAGDWLGLLALPTFDFATLLVYPDSFNMKDWGMGEEDDVARGWIRNHTKRGQAHFHGGVRERCCHVCPAYQVRSLHGRGGASWP